MLVGKQALELRPSAWISLASSVNWGGYLATARAGIRNFRNGSCSYRSDFTREGAVMSWALGARCQVLKPDYLLAFPVLHTLESFPITRWTNLAGCLGRNAVAPHDPGTESHELRAFVITLFPI